MGKGLFVCIVVIGFLVILIISRNLKLNYQDLQNNHGFLHVNIELDSKTLPLEKNIFFHETTFFNGRHIRLNSRQACAVESAARWNSEMDVYLIFVSSGRILDSSLDLFKQLLTYPNVKIRYIELGKYMADTPLEDWYKRDALKTSLWPISHLSDALRFLSLWKYGGIYLDMDVVVMKPFANLSLDFAAAESDSVIGSAVLAFSRSDVGRRVAVECVKEVNSTFQGDIWGHNGPGVITRILKKLCLTENIDAMISEPCDGFTVYPPSKFFPIPYQNWMEYFDEENTNRTMAKLENATLIHVWNKLTASQNVPTRGDSPYPIIVRENCPRIIKVSGEDF